jgi:hypothetical protein
MVPANSPLIMAGDLTTAVLDQSSFKGLVPLGSLNPSSHVFPTDHLYFYLADKSVEVPLYAPGNLTLHRLSRDVGGAGTPNQITDYTLQLGADESYLQLSHVARLTDALAAAVDFSKGECQTYTLGNGSVQKKCYVLTDIKVQAGDIIGFCGKAAGQNALDFGFYVHNKPVCPIDYYSEPVKGQLLDRFSSFDGLVKRTAMPLCGSADQNIDNTVQGVWLKPSTPKYPESEHIALVHDNIDPALPAFSIGLSVTGLSSNVYYFSPQASGLINRDFKDVTSDNQVYCYTFHTKGGTSDLPNTSVILTLLSSKSLTFEKRNCDCTCTPYNFSNPQSFIKE